uniref:Ribosomal RNA-processing protein 42 n=1 Tax=Araucaria cunninghamii TaxID=56994 RepID=A0A0D6QY09_ARACU
MVGLSLAEQHFIQGGIAQDLRSDGRGRQDFRSFSIEAGVIPQANGSARVRIGSTDVIATVKADLGRPSSYRPDQGKIEISIECSPTAAPEFERRGGDELSMELSGALQRSLLGGKSGAGAGIDLTNLKVVEGKFCWDLYIEGLVVSSDGNLLDALGIAIKVGRHYILDATSEEESQMSSAVSVSVNKLGHVCGLTKRGGAGLDPSIVLDMISVAQHVGQRLVTLVDSEIAAAEARIAD